MFVELDVFSGRPNPRWELDESSSQKLRYLQSRLTNARESPPGVPGLGYRGFLYADPNGPVRAYRGYVTTARAVLADPSFSIEQYLLNQMPSDYATLRRKIASEITRAK